MLHQQREPLTEFISCPVCCKVFNDCQQRPMSLSCGHTVCKSCLHGRLGNERCPFDQVPFPENAENLPSNYALMQLVEATNLKESSDDSLQGSEYDPKCYQVARQCIQEISVYLKPIAENSSDDEGSSTSSTDKSQAKCFLSRPLQRKVISLIQCQILEEEGRSRAARIARAIGERILSEVLAARQYPHQLSANLWAAVRARGCQFLGPAMQEEVLKLILLTLENGCMLSRKVLVLYVVGKLSSTYPHVSKTAIGHVVQLLYRASCFKVAKRDEESSLMQLKEEFREYDALRREHDAQIVQIAMEAGLRIPPEQWSSLLYGDMTHKSHMQSIMDKLQNPQSFSQCVLELVQVLQRNGDPGGFLKLRHRFEFLSCIDPNSDAQTPSLQDMKAIMQSLSMVMKAFVNFMSQPSISRRGGPHPDSQTVPNVQYKTSMCWDITTKGYCPRGNTCTFAHSQQELERHRQRSRRSMYKLGPKSEVNAGAVGKHQVVPSEVEGQLTNLSLDSNSSPSTDEARGSSSQATMAGNNKEQSWPQATDHLSKHGMATTLDHTPDAHNSRNVVDLPPPPLPPPVHSAVNGTLLTFSQPAKEAPSVNFLPQSGLQTSFHPHNMRGPPPPLHPPHHPQSFMPQERGYLLPRAVSPPSPLTHYPSYSGPQQQTVRPHGHPHIIGQQPQQLPLPLQSQQTPPHGHLHHHHHHLHHSLTSTPTTSISHNHQHNIRYPTHTSGNTENFSSSSVSSSTLSYSSPATVVTMSSIGQDQGINSSYGNTATARGDNGRYCVERPQHHFGGGEKDSSSDLSFVPTLEAERVTSSSSASLFASTSSTIMTTCTTSTTASALRMSSDQDLHHHHHHHQQQQQHHYQPHHHQQQQQHLATRMATHSSGGPDGALQSLTESGNVLHHHHQLLSTPQENTLEDLRMLKKEIIDLLQEQPTFLNSRPQVYSADSLEGGFDGLKTVLGQNQRKKEAMPKLVSDMFVATRSTKSLDMLAYPPECPKSEMSRVVLQTPPPPAVEYTLQQGCPVAMNVTTQNYSPSCVSMASPTRGITSSVGGNTLYNSLGSSFDIASSLSNFTARSSHSYPDTEFSSFPTDDDDEEMLIPFEHTVVSKFGPISRMARVKTNNCAPVQVTADSSKKMTPVLAVTPMERPVPIAMPVSSRFGSCRDQILEPSVKPTPTEAPSVWQDSPLPSEMNIALLRTGAAEAVSNNERLAYELQAIELEISLKTGKTPEPVRKMIHEAVSNPVTTMGISSAGQNDLAMSSISSQMALLMTSTSTSSSSFSSPSRNNAVNMGLGHVTEFLTTIAPGTNPVSSELAARDIMEEYQRSRKGLTKFSY